MQISAANLLIASQQSAKQAPNRSGGESFAAALDEKGKTEAFEPIAFRTVSASKESAAKPASDAGYGGVPPLGSQLDITV